MIKNITNVKGIKCWGAHSGVKSLRRDLGFIYSEVPAHAAAVFTQNKVVAAPIKTCREHIKDGSAQAIVINAGNANACTGIQGLEGAVEMVNAAAEVFNLKPSDVLIASTGIIGEPFPTEEIVNGIKAHAHKVSNKSSAGSFLANSILTTDTFAKEGFIEFSLDDRIVNMGGVAKGSGMIHPNMATMLGFIATDVAISKPLLKKAVSECVNKTFNMITVDGDTSTNDMVIVLANGMAENKEITSKEDPNYKIFIDHLFELMSHLAKLIVSDGEGSSKFITYEVNGASTEKEAAILARSIASSTLVKTAMFGRDPNWGRIVCAAGNAGIEFEYDSIDLYLGSESKQIKVLTNGTPESFDRNYMKKLLRESHLKIIMDLKKGKKSASAWGSDLTTDYVLFNSVYTT